MTEAALLDWLIGTTPDHEGIAIRFGWEVLHLRPAETAKGWRTPVQGSMGKGWPDLILARPPRFLAAELKSAKGKPTPEQVWVLDMLAACGIETHIWRPSHFDAIVEALR